MAIQWPTIHESAYKPTVPDFQEAFQKGLNTYIKANEARYAPQMSEQQLQQAKAMNAMRNLQLQQEPERFRMAQQGQSLANQIKQLQMQYAPQEHQALLDLRKGQLDLARSKAGLGGAMGDSMPLTTSAKTTNQATIQAVDNALPLIDKLTSTDTPINYGGFLTPSKTAAYDSLTSQLTDQLVAAFKLPKTNESIDLIKRMTQRHLFEPETSYRKRLKSLAEDLKSRKSGAQGALRGGINTRNENARQSNEMHFNPATGRLE